jgi:flagellar motor switch protein FliM
MAEPLNASHFKPQPRMPLSGTPEALRLAAEMAGACARGLAAHAPCPWRVSSDGVEESDGAPGDGEHKIWRFESELGSLTADISFDKPSACALIEAAMGGTGTEAPFDIGERPFSRIERAVLDLAFTSIAEQVAGALEAQLGRPFSHFPAPPAPAVLRQTLFRFVVNVFGHSGEIRVSVPTDELATQLKAGAEQTAESDHDGFQQQVGRSAVEFTVTLGPETFSVLDIAGLKPGTMLNLASTAASPVRLWSSGVPAYEARLGRAGNRLAVTITGPAAP